MIEMVSNIN